MPKSKLRKGHKQRKSKRYNDRIRKISEAIKLRSEKEKELMEELMAKYNLGTDKESNNEEE